MEEIKKEIELLKYQINLMKMFIDGDKYPFFMFVMDNKISEKQVHLIQQIIVILKARIEGDFDKYANENQDEIEVVKTKLEHLGLEKMKLCSSEKPNFDEFSNYIASFLPEVNTKYLLLSMKNQSMFKDSCEYLLKSSH